MLDHDALSFSLVPFCYGVCPFVNQLHPLPSATSGIPVRHIVARVIIPHLVIRYTFSTTLIAFNNFKHSTNDALACLIHKRRSKKAAIKWKSSCFPGRHF